MPEVAIRLGRRLMATRFEVLLCGDDSSRLRSIAEEALDEVERLEAQMSLFLPSSEISRLNTHAAFGPVPVEPRLFALLARAKRWTLETHGAFDVGVAPLVDAWGFYDGLPKDARRARRVSGARFVELDAKSRTIRFRREGVALDLGAIGKGYALDAAAAILRERAVTRALLHAGTSTIHAIGAWPIGLVDPRAPSRRVARLVLEDRSLSTSSAFGKCYEEGGTTRGHIIDPRTGTPAKGRVAAWAIARNSTDADALSTAFTMLGVEAVRRLCSAHVGVEAILMTDKRLVSIALSSPLERLSPAPSPAVSLWTRRAFVKGAAAAAAAFSIGLPARAASPFGEDKRETIRCAVIGAGDQGRLLLSQLVRLRDVKVTAVCDVLKPHREKAIAIAGRNVESYDDAAHLLEEETDVQAVILAVPTYLHASIGIASLEAGRHVFCESPLAHSIEAAKALARAAASSKKILQVGHQRRSSRLYPHAQTHIECGAIGDLVQIRAQWHRKQSWRRAVSDPKEEKLLNWRLYRETSGGLLLEQGCHAVDLANWYFGELPTSVTGIASLAHFRDGREVPDNAQALLEYPGGRQVSISASLSNSYGGEWELVIGTEGAILLLDQGKGLLFREADAVSAGWEQYAKKETLGDFRGIVLDADATKYASHEKPERLPDAGKADFFAELTEFFAAIRASESHPSDAGVGIKACVPCLVATEAIEKRRVISFTSSHFEF